VRIKTTDTNLPENFNRDFFFKNSSSVHWGPKIKELNQILDSYANTSYANNEESIISSG